MRRISCTELVPAGRLSGRSLTPRCAANVMEPYRITDRLSHPEYRAATRRSRTPRGADARFPTRSCTVPAFGLKVPTDPPGDEDNGRPMTGGRYEGAAGFPSPGGIGGGSLPGRGATSDTGRRAHQGRGAFWCGRDPGFRRRLASWLAAVVRAAGIRSRAGHQLVAAERRE